MAGLRKMADVFGLAFDFKMNRLIHSLICIGFVCFVSSCRDNQRHDGELISLYEKGQSERGPLFVVYDEDVMSFSKTKQIASRLGRSFGATEIAVVNSKVYHLLNFEMSAEFYLVGENASLLSYLHSGGMILFPTRPPPSTSPKNPVGVVLSREGAAASVAPAWLKWCDEQRVPCVQVDGMSDTDIEVGIRKIERMLIDYRIRFRGKKTK